MAGCAVLAGRLRERGTSAKTALREAILEVLVQKEPLPGAIP